MLKKRINWQTIPAPKENRLYGDLVELALRLRDTHTLSLHPPHLDGNGNNLQPFLRPRRIDYLENIWYLLCGTEIHIVHVWVVKDELGNQPMSSRIIDCMENIWYWLGGTGIHVVRVSMVITRINRETNHCTQGE